VIGKGAARTGNARWRRLTEERAGGAKSVFHFDVQGSVAKSTHAGIPWLRFIRQRPGARVHFWPFDGWDIPAGRSAIAEVYPSLWRRGFAPEGRTLPHQITAVYEAMLPRQLSHYDRYSIELMTVNKAKDGRLILGAQPYWPRMLILQNSHFDMIQCFEAAHVCHKRNSAATFNALLAEWLAVAKEIAPTTEGIVRST
jgi:hypothetical protein